MKAIKLEKYVTNIDDTVGLPKTQDMDKNIEGQQFLYDKCLKKMKEIMTLRNVKLH